RRRYRHRSALWSRIGSPRRWRRPPADEIDREKRLLNTHKTEFRRCPASAPVTLSLLGRQDHDHLAAFHRRLGLDLGDRRGLGPDPLQELEADVLMRHLAAAEAQRH